MDIANPLWNTNIVGRILGIIRQNIYTLHQFLFYVFISTNVAKSHLAVRNDLEILALSSATAMLSEFVNIFINYDSSHLAFCIVAKSLENCIYRIYCIVLVIVIVIAVRKVLTRPCIVFTVELLNVTGNPGSPVRPLRPFGSLKM